jgi:hypothetical protein
LEISTLSYGDNLDQFQGMDELPLNYHDAFSTPTTFDYFYRRVADGLRFRR